MANFYASGYTPPSGITSKDQVRRIQNVLGVKTDGIWGKNTQASYERLMGGAQQGQPNPSGAFYGGAPIANVPAPNFTGTSSYRGNPLLPSSSKGEFGIKNVNAHLPVSYAPVKNAQNAIPSTNAQYISNMQKSLNAYDPSVQVTGVYDNKTANAFLKYGNRALYSSHMTDREGNGATIYGTLDSGNAVSPWRTEEERQRANNAHLAPYGLSGDQAYRLFSDDGQFISYGALGGDNTGGVFNPDGYSSNPYYLRANAGVDREALNGAAKNASDKAITLALTTKPQYLGYDMYVTNDGRTFQTQVPGSTSIRAIRDEVAGLRGLPTVEQGFAKTYLDIPKPDFYNGPSYSAPMGPQQALDIDPSSPQGMLIAQIEAIRGSDQSMATRGTATAQGGQMASPRGDSVFDGYYNQLINTFSASDGGYTPPQQSSDELTKIFGEYLRPQVDRAISQREKALKVSRSEIDADAAARGMGSSSYVSSLKVRQDDAAKEDISTMESEYTAILSKQVYEAMSENEDRAYKAYTFEREQQQEDRQNAMNYASKWYDQYLDQLAIYQEPKKGRRGGRPVKKAGGLTYDECGTYLGMLSMDDRDRLVDGKDGYWKPRKQEMLNSLGQRQFDDLMRKYGLK